MILECVHELIRAVYSFSSYLKFFIITLAHVGGGYSTLSVICLSAEFCCLNWHNSKTKSSVTGTLQRHGKRCFLWSKLVSGDNKVAKS